MHQTGGVGPRKVAFRSSIVRQRGTLVIASLSSSSVVGKILHTLTVLSPPPVTANFPSGLRATPFTSPSCPARTPISLPLFTSHSLAVLSDDAVTTIRPLGLNVAS